MFLRRSDGTGVRASRTGLSGFEESLGGLREASADLVLAFLAASGLVIFRSRC